MASKALAPALTVIKSVVGHVLPYVQSVMSFVPGVGTASAPPSAQRKRWPTDGGSTKRSSREPGGAVAGGPMAQMAFDAAWGLAHGRPIDTSVLGALRERLPAGFAQRASDTGVALAAAKTAQDRHNALKTAALGALAPNLLTVPPLVPFRPAFA